MKKTVKVRGRKGTATMDLSLPAAITRKHDIERGDVFSVDTRIDEKDRLVVEYTLVFDGE